MLVVSCPICWRMTDLYVGCVKVAGRSVYVSAGVTSVCFGSDRWACPHCIFCNLMLQLAQGPLHQEALGATLCAADHSHAKIFKTRNSADAAGSVTWSTPASQPSHHIVVWQQPMQKPVRPPVHHFAQPQLRTRRRAADPVTQWPCTHRNQRSPSLAAVSVNT